VADIVISLLATLGLSLFLDATVQPRRARWRRLPGVVVHVAVMTGVFGLFLAASGNAVVAAVAGIALMALFAVAANAKYRVLGEPAVFSDLAMLVAIVRHPRFYFSAISIRQRCMLGIAAVIAVIVLVSEVRWSLPAHLIGLALLSIAAGGLWATLRSRWMSHIMRVPDLDADMVHFGLICTLLVYWQRWRATIDPPPAPPLTLAAGTPELARPEVIVVIQCESFADPVALTGDARLALPGLAAARAGAWQHGDLAVSGFGAYTMRSEYGVLFGRSEAALGFRRYDPFLSAAGEASYALSALLRTAGYRSTFVHPHDLRFYARDQLMPAIGFDRVIGEEAFAPPAPGGDRYIDDRTLGAMIGDVVTKEGGPTFLYAVTMENHGPWDSDRETGLPGGLDAYLRHARSSDAMLSGLAERLAADGRPALLVFFGDHRPSIPGVSMPGADRHTPYVMLRFAAGGARIGSGARVDLTPADLHHAVLACL
jgi:hypothetical protein